MNGTSQRRIWFGLLAITLLIAFLIGRLAWIQVVDTASFSRREIDLIAGSVAQREFGIELDSGRGHFYDRDGKPLTGQSVRALLVFPVRRPEEKYEASLREIARILQTDPQVWTDFYRNARVPKMWADTATGLPLPLTEAQAKRITELSVPGVEVMNTVRRYPEQMAAKHVIGFIGENPERIQTHFMERLQKGSLSLTSRIGAAGLEKTMERYLEGAGKTSVSLFTDAAARPLAGLDVRLVSPSNPYYPLKIGTTIDKDIQLAAEQILKRNGISAGAAVVLDVRNGDIVAMASRPDFDPYRLDMGSGSWGNKAVKAIAPGSVFKTVVAAAALEEGVVRPGETFECDGKLGKYGFTCWLHGGHGMVTLGQAFAESCNIAFAKVMMRLSGEKLQETARKLGLDQTVGWKLETGGGAFWSQLDGEERGQIFDRRKPSEDEGIRVQTAIGQRDVLVTPLQAANLVVTLLNGGETMSPRIVRDVRYSNDTVARKFPEHPLNSDALAISKRTAQQLLEWMKLTVKEGTGKALQGSVWSLAGKSGTAQTRSAGQPGENQWFVGYGPSDRPQYAVAVVAQNEPENGRNRAIAAFGELMDALAAHTGTKK